MIERHFRWSIDKDTPRPVRFSPFLNLLYAKGYIAARAQNNTANTLRIYAAIIFHPLVVGTDHSGFEFHIVMPDEGAEPTGWQGQIYINPLQIHVFDAFVRIVVHLR